MESVQDLRAKIDGQAARLDSLNGADGKRIRKRVLAALGKLKKQLADAEASEASVSNKRARLESTSQSSKQGGDCVEDGVESSETETFVPKKQLKAKLHLLNKELSEFAQKKQLKNAIKSFVKARKKGIPVDVHSFANLINVYVRCGDIDSAQKQVVDMKGLGILPNGVLLTTLIKGYCENGNLVAAREILDGMCGQATPVMFPHIVYSENTRPNIRTINTFFRGCIRVGDVNSALSYFERFKNADSNQLGVSPDKTTYEYVILLLCQALRYNEAKDILSKYSVCEDSSASGLHSSDVSDSASVYISMTRCAILVCEFDEAGKWMEIARTCLQFAQNAPLREAMLKQKDSHKASETGTGSSRDNGRNVSMFLQHQQNEMEGELELFAQFLQCVRNHPDKPVQLDFTKYLISSMSKLLYFDYDSLSSPSGGTAAAAGEHCGCGFGKARAVNRHLVETLVEKFGLQRLLAVHKRLVSVQPGGDSEGASADLGAQTLKSVMASVSKSNCIQFDEVFGGLVEDNGVTGSVHLEIGAGYGEWVIEQAWCAAPRSWEGREAANVTGGQPGTLSSSTETKAEGKKGRRGRRHAPVEVKSNIHVYDEEQHAEMLQEERAGGDKGAEDSGGRGRGHWVSLELRCDRVYSTFTRNVLKRFIHSLSADTQRSEAGGRVEAAGEMRSNLLILGGDANSILNSHFPPGRVSSIHINHPEPPERTGHFKDGAGKSGGGLINCNDSSNWASGRHLLTKAFFDSMCSVLKERGTITIVTDNKNYGIQLAREIWLLNDTTTDVASRLRCPFFKCSNFALSGATGARALSGEAEESFEDSDAVVAGGMDDSGSGRTLYRVIDSVGNVLDPQSVTSSSSCFTNAESNIYVYQGEAPAVDCGTGAGRERNGDVVATAASSYFDRMWNLGEMKRRWFVHVKKSV